MRLCACCGTACARPQVCGTCKSACYCNAQCQRKHRNKHKHACRSTKESCAPPATPEHEYDIPDELLGCALQLVMGMALGMSQTTRGGSERRYEYSVAAACMGGVTMSVRAWPGRDCTPAGGSVSGRTPVEKGRAAMRDAFGLLVLRLSLWQRNHCRGQPRDDVAVKDELEIFGTQCMEIAVQRWIDIKNGSGSLRL